jgi:hypothetical protein
MSGPQAGAGRLDPVWAGLIAGAVALALAQASFYADDGLVLLGWLERGRIRHPWHALYLPLLDALRAPASAVGWTNYELARGLSALGLALGCGASCAGLRWMGLARGEALLAALLAAAAPAVLFFGTVVEIHGPFYAFAGASALALGWLVRAPSAPRALALGASTALSVGMHSSGHLLAVLCALGFAAQRARACGARRTFALCALVFAAHAALAFALARAWTALGWLESEGAAAKLVLRGYTARDAAGLLRTLVSEWLVPFAPLSLAWAWGRRPELRAERCAFAAVLVLYLALSFALLGGHSERGAYLLPLAIPAASLSVRSLGRAAWPALALALGLAITAIRAHDDPHAQRAFAAGVRALDGAPPAGLLLVERHELSACAIELPQVEAVFLPEVAGSAPGDWPQALHALRARVDDARARGAAWYLTRDGRAYLERADLPSTRWLLQGLEQQYELVPAASGAFAGWRLEPRAGAAGAAPG